MRLALSVALAVATAAALFAPAASAQSQAAISINFRGNGGNLVTGPAGAVGTTPFGGWNNVNGGSGSGVVVLDHAGVDRGVRLAFASASAGYQLNPAATSQDGNLYDGQIIATVAAGPATVTVSNVPYAQYDVVVYFGHGPSHVGRDESLTIGSRVVCYQNENLQTYVNPVTFRQVTTTSVPGQAGNYAVFAGETGSSFTLVMAPAAGGTPGSTGMAGLQIVDRGADTDNDGLNDAWELQWFGNLSQTAAGDPDADQLNNLGEQQRGTSPVDADSDDDGLTDGAEVARGTDPLDGDSDDDELSDGVETDTGIFVNLNNTGTDPLLVDTDGDGSRDGAEVRRRSNPCDPNSRPQLPNVVLILADDLGWGEVGAFGQQLIRTPNLDQMAADGMRFTQFYCGSPVCAPTRSTIQTGLHTGHTEIRNNLASAALDPGTFTLGNMLQREGYTTAFIGKWGIGDTGTTGHPNLQGYDHFFGFLDQTHAHWYYPSYLWRNGQQVLYPTNNGVAGPTNNGTLHAQDEMTAEALTWLDNHHDRPFFLQLAYCIPHVSLQEPPHSDPARRALGETAVEEFYPNIGWAEPNANFASSHYTSNARPRQAYAAMISALDRDVGLVLAKLQQHGIEDDTLVLFTSDNGTTYCCGVDRTFFNSLNGLRGYKGEVYEGGIRVPTIARWPGKVAPSTTSNHVGAVWDILPTVADLIDAETPANLDGVSFLPTLMGQPAQCQEQHEYLYWEYAQSGQRKAVRMGDYKGVRYGEVGAGAALQLFNLATDPGETTNLAAQQPAIAAVIERIMAARHTFEPQFFRANDEFPVISGATLSNASPYLQLNATGVGYVMSPLVRDAVQEVSLPLQAQLQDLAGRNANVALLVGASTSTASAVSFEINALLGLYRISHQGLVAQAALLPGTDPYAWFDVTCNYDPATGIARMIDRGQPVVTLQLAAPPALVSHYGYRVDNATTKFRPLDPAIDGRWRASWQAFGTGCGGTFGVPLLRAVPSSVPATSSCFDVEVLGFPAVGGVAFGVAGLSDAQWSGGALPTSLASYGMPGCSLLVSPDATTLLAASQGRALWSLVIPNVPALSGYRIHQQAAVLDPGANQAGVVVTNAGAATIGGR